MNFKDLILKAKEGDNASFEKILKMYQPLMMKESIIDNTFDEDLYQEQCIVLMRCVTLFEI